MSAIAASWNGGKGHPTRRHVAGEDHATAICGVVIPWHNEDAEVDQHFLPMALKHSRSTCNNCMRIAAEIGLKIFYDPKRGERF